MNFQELMDCYAISKSESNEETYSFLKEQVKKDNVIPVIGAGLSIWAEYPSWRNLLLENAKRDKKIEKQVEENLNEGRYDEAAEILHQVLGTSRWYRLLEKEFAPDFIEANRSKRPEYQNRIPQIFKNIVLTTNFDRCIEDLYGNIEQVNPSDIFQKNQIDRATFFKEALLVKLHGDIKNPEKMVLTTSGYNSVYGDDINQPDMNKELPAYLAKRMGNSPLLFLGASLHQDRTCMILRGCSSSGTHFALLPLPNETENKQDPLKPILKRDNEIIPVLDQRIKELNEMNIFPIWYPKGMHNEALEAFFEKLADDYGVSNAQEEKVDFRYCTMHDIVGRKEVLKKIVNVLKHKKGRCVWVQGPAGIGKTEICREAHNKMKAKNPEWEMPFIDLTEIKNLPSFYSQLSTSANIQIPIEQLNDPREYLIQELKKKYIQKQYKFAPGLYFDNWEDIWRNSTPASKNKITEFLLDLYHNGFSLLFSSQVGSPDNLPVETYKIESLEEADSIALFQQVYGKKVRKNDVQEFRKLINQLNGHPLAIVLTATQAKKLVSGIKGLLDRWDATQETYGIKWKHKSLSCALNMVWDSICENKKAVRYWVMQYYSVCPIPFDCHQWLLENGIEDEALQILYDNSMLVIDDDECTVGMLLPLKKQLPRFLEENDSNWQEGLFVWTDALINLYKKADDSADDNYREAHKYAQKLMPQVCHMLMLLMKMESEESIKKIIDLIGAVHNYFTYYVPSLKVLENLKKFSLLKDYPKTLAEIYLLYGEQQIFAGAYKKAAEAYERSEELYRALEDKLGLANVLIVKGDILLRKGKSQEAKTVFLEAENLYRELEDSLGLANVLVEKGSLFLQEGFGKEAKQVYEEAELLYRELNSGLGLANVLIEKGDLLILEGNMQEAKAVYCEAECLYRQLNEMLGLANVLIVKGNLFLKEEKCVEAKECYDESKKLYQELDSTLGLANVNKHMGHLMRQENKNSEAQKSYTIAEKLYLSLNAEAETASAMQVRGARLFLEGSLQEAKTAYTEAEKMYRIMNDIYELANTLKGKSIVLEAEGDLEAAGKAKEEAKKLLDTYKPI